MQSSSDNPNGGSGSNAESWLASLDPVGWRFGLERIEALLRALDSPQLEFDTLHVVGTNGKSSTVAMLAALLESAGKATGAYFSPHTERWSERIQLRGEEITPGAFAEAAETVRSAVREVEAGFERGERITQFEAATAVAFVALARAGVEVGVIEAGLGGRLDATNVLRSSVTVLTSVGLDHTQWLGESEEEIAAEKLAVLRGGTALVVGELSPAVRAIAERTAAEKGCSFLAGEGAPQGGRAPYLDRNATVAATAASIYLGSDVNRAMASPELPGRFEILHGEPPLILDAAHNPQGAAALAEALRVRTGGRPVIACLAVLADKDAAGIVGALAPAVREVVATEIPAPRLAGSGRPGAASVPAADLCRICADAGLQAVAIDDPDRAVRHALSRAQDVDGVALAAGSHYLLGYAWTERRAQSFYR